MKHYSFLEKYADYLINKSIHSSEIGLWNGKMGSVIYLLHLSKINPNKKYELVASQFIDQIFEQLSYNIPLTYANGLLGIGCGIQYIISEKFVKGDSDTVLADIDDLVIYSVDVRTLETLSLDFGICGIGFYLYSRLKNKSVEDDSLTTLRKKEMVIYLIDWIEELLLKTNDVQDICDVYFLLTRLYRLNIINFKIEKNIDFCLCKISALQCPVYDKYDMLGVNSLKLLKKWM